MSLPTMWRPAGEPPQEGDVVKVRWYIADANSRYSYAWTLAVVVAVDLIQGWFRARWALPANGRRHETQHHIKPRLVEVIRPNGLPMYNDAMPDWAWLEER